MVLLSFSVGNFLSFSEIQELSLIPGKQTGFEDHIIKTKKANALRSSFIYGANSSGKTNVIDAIIFSRSFIIQDPNMGGFDTVCKPTLIHHNNDGVKTKEPAYFEYIFELKDRCYSYGFKVDPQFMIVYEEWLFEITECGDYIEIFSIQEGSRSNGIISSSNNELLAYYESYKSNSVRSLFLTYVSQNYQNNICFEIYSWYLKSFIIRKYESMYQPILVPFKSIVEVSNALFNLGTGISNSDVNLIELENYFNFYMRRDYLIRRSDKNIDGNPRKERNKTAIFHTKDVKFYDRILSQINTSGEEYCFVMLVDEEFLVRRHSNGKFNTSVLQFLHGKNNFTVKGRDESFGTKQAIKLLLIFNSLPYSIILSDDLHTTTCFASSSDEDKIIILDELECSLYTKINKKIIQKFFSTNTTTKTQLITTTHETAFLSKKLLRVDEIYFVDIDEDENPNLHSVMYSLNKFKNSELSNLDEAYLKGKYGAIPIIKDIVEDE